MTALCVARPLFPSESAASYGDGLTMVMLWIALAVFWLLGAIGRPQFSIRFGWTDAAVLLLVGWHTVAALWAVGHGTPRPAINMLWEWVGMGLCFFLARQFIATAREARAVAAVMVALAVALSGYGLYQCAYELPQHAGDIPGRPRPGAARRRPVVPARLARAETLREPTGEQRTVGHLRPDQLAGRVSGAVAGDVGGRGSAAAGRNRKRLAGVWLLCLIPIAAACC